MSITYYKVKVFVVERDSPIKLKNYSSPDKFFPLFSREQLSLEVCPHDLGTPIYIFYIQGVPGGMCQTSGGCSLC